MDINELLLALHLFFIKVFSAAVSITKTGRLLWPI